jgi:hypothetical protein
MPCRLSLFYFRLRNGCLGLPKSTSCTALPVRIGLSAVKQMSFDSLKRQETQRRMAAVRVARRSPQAAARMQRRASLLGGAAKARITNLTQVARAIARWP